MSRKRDTNWTRDEITVLLDSIMEITKMRADDGRRTNSREVFEYAAKKLGEKGHTCRAEREKCRTKWKKMKEEFTHAKKARETGQGRVAPGIEPFYSRMLDFINGNFQNISPHSTIVRRSSSISSNMNNISNISNSNNYNGTSHNSSHTDSSPVTQSPPVSITTPSTSNGSGNRASASGSRTSARIAANIHGTVANDVSDTSSTNVTRQSNNIGGTDFHRLDQTNAEPGPMLRQHSRLADSRAANHETNGITNGVYPPVTPMQNVSMANKISNMQPNHQQITNSQPHQTDPQQVIPCGDTSNLYNSFTKNSPTTSDNNTSLLNNSDDSINHNHRDADISYRVSAGFRQITIFGHHDVDIKFRENCVTINKISLDHVSGTSGHSSES